MINKNSQKNLSQAIASVTAPAVLSTIVSIALYTAAHSALAESVEKEPSTPILEETFVTASRFAQPIDNVIGSVDVLTAEDIQALRPFDLPELINYTNNVQLRRTGGRGGLATVGLRGASSAQTLQLVNGQRFGSATVGGSRSDMLAPEFIDSVEILRSNGTTVYGSDAMGGVINMNLIGQELAPSEINVGAAHGNNTYYRDYFIGSKKIDKAMLTLGGRREYSNGIDSTVLTAGGSDDRDPYSRKNGIFSVYIEPSVDSSVSLLTLHNKSSTDFDDLFARDDAPSLPGLRTDARVVVNQLSGHRKVNDAYTVKLIAGYGQDMLETVNALGFSSYRFETQSTSIDWANHINVSDLGIIFGASKDSTEVDTTSPLANKAGEAITQRSVDAGYLQINNNGKVLRYSLGLRYEDNSQFGTEVFSSFGLQANFTPQYSMYFQVDEAFLAPTFNQLYLDFGPSFSGNENLEPETSTTHALGLQADYQMLNINLTAYSTDYEGLIISANNSYENVTAARIQGVEAKLTLSDNWIGEFVFGLDLLSATNTTTGQAIKRIPTEKLFVTWNKKFGPVLTSLYSNAQSNNAAVGEEVAGFGVVDFITTWDINEYLSVTGKASNIFDREYQYGANYNEEPRGYLVGADFRF